MFENTKIRLKASYTIENAIIVPLFLLIILMLLYLNFYMHDIIIVKTAITGVAIQSENEDNQEIIKQKISKLPQYLSLRCMFFKHNYMDIKTGLEENYAPNHIRVLNALHKLSN